MRKQVPRSKNLPLASAYAWEELAARSSHPTVNVARTKFSLMCCEWQEMDVQHMEPHESTPNQSRFTTRFNIHALKRKRVGKLSDTGWGQWATRTALMKSTWRSSNHQQVWRDNLRAHIPQTVVACAELDCTTMSMPRY